MARYALRRLSASVVMLALTSILIFVALRVIPGNPVITRFGATRGVDPRALDALVHQLGLDKSIPEQYLDWVGGVVRGDFGVSYFNQFSVTTLIGQRLLPTLELAAVALVLALLIAVPAGIIAGMRPNSLIDRALSGFVTMLRYCLRRPVRSTSLPPIPSSAACISCLTILRLWLRASCFG